MGKKLGRLFKLEAEPINRLTRLLLIVDRSSLFGAKFNWKLLKQQNNF